MECWYDDKTRISIDSSRTGGAEMGLNRENGDSEKSKNAIVVVKEVDLYESRTPSTS